MGLPSRREVAEELPLDVYPDSDGEPMGESDVHVEELCDYSLAVRREGVYVAGNNFVYYKEGDRRVVVSPDIYVVKGVAHRLRRSFKVWEEGGHRPAFVLELTSLSTREEDLGEKMMRYRDDLEVAEYFLFDPREEWIGERLRGFRLSRGVYQPIPAGPNGRLFSQELGLELGAQGGHLRYYLPGAGEPLETRLERADRTQSELDRERARAAALEAELARLRARTEGRDA